MSNISSLFARAKAIASLATLSLYLLFNTATAATQLSGNVVLPNGAVANGSITTQISIFESGDNIAFPVNSATTFAEIFDGDSQASFVLDLPQLDSGVGYEVMVACSQNCSGYLSQYLQSDGQSIGQQPELVLPENLPNSVNLELLAAESLSGTITIPDTINLENNTAIEVSLVITNDTNTSFFSDFVSFPAGSNSQTFDISYLADADSDFQLFFFCLRSTSDCQTLQDQVAFSGGEIVVAEKNIPQAPISQLPPSPLNIDYPTGEILDLTLKTDIARQDDTFIDVEIETINEADMVIQVDSVAAIISPGQTQTTLSTVYRSAEPGNRYRVNVKCDQFSCAGLRRNTFLNTTGELTSDSAEITSIPNSLELTIPASDLISGQISLPNGLLASEDITTDISLITLNNNGDFSDFINPIRRPVILAGTNSASFQIELPETEFSSAQLSYQCLGLSSDCGISAYDGVHYYTPNGTEFLFEKRLFSSSQLPRSLELAYAQPTFVSGSVVVPDGQNISNATTAFVELNLATSENNIFPAQINFPVNSNQQNYPFTIALPPIDFSAVSVRVGCNSFGNCGNILGSKFLTPSGVTLSDSGFFPLSDLPNPLDIELPIGQLFETTIKLPNNMIASLDTEVGIVLRSYDSEDVLLSQEERLAFIDSGASEVVVSVPYSTDAPESFTVSVGCNINCEDLLATDVQYITPTGTELMEIRASLSRQELLSLGVLELTRGSRITGSARLPDGLTSSDFPDGKPFVSIELYLLDEEGIFGRVIDFDLVSFLENDLTSDTFSLLLPPLNQNSVILRYRCSGSSETCGSLVNSYYYADARVVHTSLEADRLTSAANGLTLPLISSVASTRFSTKRSVSDRDFELPVDIEYSIDVLNQQNEITARLEFGDFMFSRATDSFGTIARLPETDGRYIVTVRCVPSRPTFNRFVTSDCSNFVQGAPSYTQSFAATQLPDTIDFNLINLTDSIPLDEFEPDDQASQAQAITNSRPQSRSIHQEGNQDWVKFILARESSIEIEAISSDPSDGKPTIELLADDLSLIESGDDNLDRRELNSAVSIIRQPALRAGSYFVRASGFSTTSTIENYSLRISGLEEDLCFSVVTKSGSVAVVCL